jgi:hypothetical protein
LGLTSTRRTASQPMPGQGAPPCRAASIQQATARGAGPSGAGRGWPTPVATAKSVDGPQGVRRDRYRSHARRGPTQTPQRWKREQRGRAAGRCRRQAGQRQDDGQRPPYPARGGWRKAAQCIPAPPWGRLTLDSTGTHRFGGRPTFRSGRLGGGREYHGPDRGWGTMSDQVAGRRKICPERGPWTL